MISSNKFSAGQRIERAIFEKEKFLSLNNCGLNDHSQELSLLKEYTFLETLDLSNDGEINRNSFTTIPENLPASLKSLTLRNCGIRKIENLNHLKNLQFLNISDNEIEEIENLDKLPDLTCLYLHNNLIERVENLDHLEKLADISLYGNRVKDIDPEYLKGNSIEFLKEYLIIQKYSWKIKIDIENHDKTGILDLSNCNLQVIPAEISEMIWLTELYLFENEISNIEHLEKLTKLKVLKLADNKISKIANLDTLVNLTYLSLRYNNIQEITGLEKLTKLTRLNLSHNDIRSIQKLLPFIKKKKPLRISLEASYNSNEKGIILFNNPIAEPPKEKILEGNPSIIQFFNESRRYGRQTLDILKIILVGNSNVGKSDLSRFLRKKGISKEHQSTQVLDIQPWNLELNVNGEKRKVNIYIYDFGGQDYYHDAHRMYFSEDTAYIVLWDEESNQFSEKTENFEELDTDSVKTNSCIIYDDYPLSYWLESIKFNLEGIKNETEKINTEAEKDIAKSLVPVFVLQNKIDLGKGCINQEKLSEQFKNIWGFYGVSLLEKKRTKILEEVIVDFIESHKIVGRELIKYEYSVFEYFMKNNEPLKIMNLQEFKDKCVEIIDDNTIPFDVDKARTIAKMLNNTGLIYFDKHSDTIYSNVLEFNKLIKDVMFAAKKGNDKGLFRLNDLKKQSQVQFSEQIIDLLCRNNSIIELDDDEFVAPQFLPTQPDQNISFFLNAFKHNNVRYLYPAYFHKSILLNLFAKYISKNDESNSANKLKYFPFWRNGIIIRKTIDEIEQTVLVEFNKTPDEGVINIKTINPFSKNSLEHEIEGVIDELNKGWTVEKEISVDSENFFNLNQLKEDAANGIYQFANNKKKFSINDFKHLADFDDLPARIFISYSSKNTDFIHRFITHLEVLKSNNFIDYWYDRKIEPGTRWDDTIKDEMSKSDIFIFMLSPDFLANRYIFDFELPQAIKQFDNGISSLFFVELQPCGWQRTEIRNYQQTVNKDGSNKDVEIILDPKNDAVWNKIINQLEDTIQNIKRKKEVEIVENI